MSRKLNYNHIKQIIENENYRLISTEYINATGKLTLVCDKGHVYETSWNNFQQGKRCKLCSIKKVTSKNTYGKDEFKENLKQITNGECIALDDYIDSKTNIRFKHLVCGNTFITKPSHVLQGHYCKKCGDVKTGNSLRKSHEDYEREVFNLVGNEYTVISKYQKDNLDVEMLHNKCNRTFTKRAGNFLQGIRCPHCCESKGEKKVFDFLVKHNIPHEREYRDIRCKNKKPLPFDFAIIIKGVLMCLIEYDGELHYHEAGWTDSEDILAKTKFNDTIKDKFCFEYNIPLIRIPYWEFDNIEKVMTTELTKLSIL